jgi:hypothetical protein
MLNAMTNDNGLLNHFLEVLFSFDVQLLTILVLLSDLKLLFNKVVYKVNQDEPHEYPHTNHNKIHFDASITLTVRVLHLF